ncbi:Transcription factor Pcc1 [Cordyceps militaris CM01]|uniref:Transcription factor Pcc1 n=2 Tax=Cordyceps militaris TaxID=73501 RepID=G3JJS0_CORMM|nr:Transcription factor Pcc1 [Cordyceps militaris CM01]ATY58329.1 Transcription factor Pcc1 [Cordyceps militaris]EGX92104.1 Transcription factor Pcc1 [Cordyceps militaris CM01]
MMAATDAAFPCSIELQVPFPTERLASTALQAIGVDPELSPLVRRSLSVARDDPRVLHVDYRATTNRMLRVAVNSFMDSLQLVVGVMEQLDEIPSFAPPAPN